VDDQLLSIGPMARLCGLLEKQLLKLCNRSLVPYRRVGSTRIFAASDAPAVRAAAVAAGYLPTSESEKVVAS
jgi:hypothetical protein